MLIPQKEDQIPTDYQFIGQLKIEFQHKFKQT